MGGMIRNITMRTTRKKKQMACLILEDLIGCIEIVVFPQQFEKYRSLLQEGALVFCKGKVKSEDEKDANLQLDSVSLFSNEDQKRSVWLQFADFTDYQIKETSLSSITHKYPGKGGLYFYLKNTKQIKQGKRGINLDKTCLDELIAICSQENVKVK
mgnify:FL=1